MADANLELLLRRSNTNINVWSGANRDSGLVTTQDQVVITVPAGGGGVYVEWVSMDPLQSESFLELLVRDKATLQVTVLDRVRFYPFSSIVVGFVGEFQSPGDPTTGMHQMVTRLYQAGYDARIYDEDDVGYDTPQGFRPAPEQAAHNAIYNAVMFQGVQEVALFGYSHGGGAVYNLSWQLANDWNTDGQGGDAMPGNRLVFTAYIDAVAKRSGRAQTNRPVNSQYHYNIYQQPLDSPTDLVSGDNMGATADVNENVEDAAGTIHRPDAVHGFNTRRGIAEMTDVQDAVFGLRPGWPEGLTKRVRR